MRHEKLFKVFLAIFSFILFIGVFTVLNTEDAKAGVWKYVCCDEKQMRSVTIFSAWVFLNSLSLPQESKEVYSLFYFGATSCAFCVQPQTLKILKRLKRSFLKNIIT